MISNPRDWPVGPSWVGKWELKKQQEPASSCNACLASSSGAAASFQAPVPEVAVLSPHLLAQPRPGVTLNLWLKTASAWRPDDGLIPGGLNSGERGQLSDVTSMASLPICSFFPDLLPSQVSSVLVFSTGSSFRIVLKPWPVSVLQSSRPPAGRGTLVRKLS